MIRILMAICSYPRDRCEEPKWRTTGEWCVRWAPSVLLRPRGRNRDGRRRWWEEPFRPQARSLATHSLLPSPAPGARHSLTPFLATLGALFRHPNPPRSSPPFIGRSPARRATWTEVDERKEKMWRGKEVTTRNRRSLTGTTGELK